MNEEAKKLKDSDTPDHVNETELASSEGSAPEAELNVLREQLEAKEEEAKQNYERLMRQTAELENFKKRAIRDKEESIRFGNEMLVKDLLSIIDNLERAVAHSKTGGDPGSLLEGMEMILKGFLDVMGKHGVVQVAALGEPFDPQVHEAIAQVETTDREPNAVVEEHQKGYLLKDRLLRPALVTVAAAPAAK